MRRSSRFAGLLSAALCLHALTAYAAEENRCGWFSNPTPGNAWLKDRDGEWTIGTQGNHDTCRNDRRLGKASE